MSQEKLKQFIDQSSHTVFFGGAGVSTESGIPDFRSETGIYRVRQKYSYSPETLLSHDFFMNHPDIFYDFYRNTMIYAEAKPNAAHQALASLEKQGKIEAVITQNIDGLHQKAGSKNVLELHGSVCRNYCLRCGKAYTLEAILNNTGCPKCECGGLIKPDVVLYGEQLDQDILERSIALIKRAEVLIVAGTSLSVYPAAGLIRYYHGGHLILINKSITSYDGFANLLIHDSVGKTLEPFII